jgi:uncharacterized membrane protein
MTEPPVPPTPPATPPPSASPPGGTVSPNRSMMIVLSYLGLLALVPLLVEKDDREVQWHAKHGLVLTVGWIILFIALAVVERVLASVFDWGCFGCFFSPTSLVWVAALVVHVLAIFKGLNGQRLIIPGVSEFADKF